MKDEINNSSDYLDSHDIEDRIVFLAEDIDDYKRDVEKGVGADKILEEMNEELLSLCELKQEYVDSFGESSWGFGAQFIRDSYFEDYAREFADDIGAINDKMPWPSTHIDWEAAAEELKMDYTEVDFDGVIYQTREA